ncbi:MAG: bifunctional 5,10-methylenetetrahydrofolate dehydrogenase/5,10-methenyltetrahydrofolate cyclohydrolase [Bacilli bacterium]|jgi:methylenetetrahydrofolate dehydrogenase (NADP+)/methenyltetrahydrofolate cyclohydrolase
MDIKTYVLKRKQYLKDKITRDGGTPSLAIIQVNDDFASNKYIAGKINDAKEVGINATLIKLPETTAMEVVLRKIKKLNKDPHINGIIVQLPLPKHIDENIIKEAISPAKDVDGFHPLSRFKACTPLGIVNYLKNEGIEISGKNVVIIGRSNIVGKPAALLFLAEDGNVTVLHSRTKAEDLKRYVANADIIVVAVGRKHFINDEHTLKKSAVLVDVGINRNDDGSLTGDIKPGRGVFLQTPVPGGVGLLTRLTLLENVMEAYLHGI